MKSNKLAALVALIGVLTTSQALAKKNKVNCTTWYSVVFKMGANCYQNYGYSCTDGTGTTRGAIGSIVVDCGDRNIGSSIGINGAVTTKLFNDIINSQSADDTEYSLVQPEVKDGEPIQDPDTGKYELYQDDQSN